MSKKIWIRLPPSYTAEKLKTIRLLASKGLNKSHIARQLVLPANMFNKYRECEDAFSDGRSDLGLKVAESFEINLKLSYSDRALLAKNLRLFSTGFSVPEIVDAESAMKALTKAIQVFAAGNLSIDELSIIRQSCSTFSDLHAGNILEKRLEHLEELLTNGKAKAGVA